MSQNGSGLTVKVLIAGAEGIARQSYPDLKMALTGGFMISQRQLTESHH